MSSEPVVLSVGDLQVHGRSGVLQGFACEQLNVNFVMLEDGEVMASHRNDEVEVVIVVQSGEGVLIIDDQTHELTIDSLAIVPRGSTREIRANSRLLYFTIHQRRDGVAVQTND